jgi:hypothetical protein
VCSGVLFTGGFDHGTTIQQDAKTLTGFAGLDSSRLGMYDHRMTIEPAYADAEETLRMGAMVRGLSQSQAEWVDSFYRNVQIRMLNLYEGARISGSRIYDREKLARYWLEKLDWFSSQLAFNRRTETNLKALGANIPPVLADSIEILNDIVEACKEHLELHA